MKNILSFRLLFLLTLFVGTLPDFWAENRFFAEALNFEPGETRQIAFCLENSQDFFGFQADINLPDGLEFVMLNGKADLSLSSRANSSFTSVSNLLSERTLRMGAFSTNHTAISGNSGTLVYVNVRASESFTQGILSVSNILFTDSSDIDLSFPNCFLEIGSKHINRFFIPDFNIAVGETKEIEMVLSNDTRFTAFQTDIFLPEGLSVVDNGWTPTSRCPDHSISAKSFSDGRLRLICFSNSNTPISGNSGALLKLRISSDKDAAEKCVIELKNQLFSMVTSKEYVLPNTSTTVSIDRTLIESITLSQTSASLSYNETLQLTADVLPALASTKDLVWSSSDPAIVSVDATGLLSALTPGTATITAAAVDGSGVTANCVVTVSGIPVSSITLDTYDINLEVGQKSQLVASVNPQTATDRKVIWKSGNIEIAEVDNNGLVSAINIGSTVVYAEATDGSGVRAICNVTVVPTLATGIKISTPQSISFKVGQTLQLLAIVEPENTSDKSVVWSVSDSSLASVDKSGMVTALSVGEVVVTATNSAGYKDEITLSVVPTLAESISISPSSATLRVGQTATLSATVLPASTTDKTINWKSSDTSVAIVDGNGTVTAIGIGMTEISAYSSDGSKVTAKVLISVEPTPASGISISYDGKTSIRVGESVKLEAIVTPDDATDKSVVWEVQDQTILDVDDYGTVTAKEIGEAWVSATNSAGQSEFIFFNVVPTPVASISLISSEVSLKVGESFQISATVGPDDATDKCLNFISANSQIASIDANGIVYAVSPGQTVITISAADGSGVSSSCNVTVTDPDTTSGVHSISIDGVSIMVNRNYIVVKNLPDGKFASVFSSKGSLIATQQGMGDDIIFNVPQRQIYIVSLGKYAIKVFVP